MAFGLQDLHTLKESNLSEAEKKDIMRKAEAFLLGVSKKNRNFSDDLLPTYYCLSLGYIWEVVESLDKSNELKKELYLPLAYLHSETGLMLERDTHLEVLKAAGKTPKAVQDAMAKTTVHSLLQIKNMHLARVKKVSGEITEHLLYNLKTEVHDKCHALDSWWRHAYIASRAPESIEEIWEKKGKTDMPLSNNCANVSQEQRELVRNLIVQPTYKIMTGENRKIEIDKNDKNTYLEFGRHYIADRFLDYAAFLFQDPFMYKNVLSKYSL